MYPEETIRELHLYLQFIDPSIFCPSVPPRQSRVHVIVYIIMISPLKIHYLLSLVAFYSSGKTPSQDEPNFPFQKHQFGVTTYYHYEVS